MSRIHVISFENVAVSAAQDLFEVNANTGANAFGLIRVLRCIGGCTDAAPSAQMLALRARLLNGEVTHGSGGTNITNDGSPAPCSARMDFGDQTATTAGFDAYVNSTTKASSSGTSTVAPQIIYEKSCSITDGWDEKFDFDGRGNYPIVHPNASFVFELLIAPSSTIHLSATLWIEELGKHG